MREVGPLCSQLSLPFAPPAPVEDQLGTRAGRLTELADALRLLLAVADGRVPPSPASLPRVRDALEVVAAFNPGGRLGHVVRRFRESPPGSRGWVELAGELEFAASLWPTRSDS